LYQNLCVVIVKKIINAIILYHRKGVLMEISSKGSVVTIKDNIKSISDFQSIKKCLDELIANDNRVTIDIIDSMSMTSSVIGYLTKIIFKDKVQLCLRIGDQRLYDLLDELNLISQFNVRKVKS